MFSLSTISLALSLGSGSVLSSQTPTTRQTINASGKDSSDDGVVRTPGKLRVTEDSGICGTSQALVASCNTDVISTTLHHRDNARCVSSIRVRRYILGPKYLVSLLSILSIQITHPSTYRFWFFESRNSPETDPLVVWFNGGVSTVVTSDASINAHSPRCSPAALA